ncbi:MAG TPA: glycosyl transferase family 2, partial [Lachnospiraceae bacterium]|nr:glycosyl transferase family 2 [Lachnospiraceae bacterium]
MKGGNLHEDYLCWLEILKDGGTACGINEPLLNYRSYRASRSG